MRELYAGNLEYGDAADPLRDGIEFFASNLSHIGEELPASWIKVRADIEVRAGEAAYIPQQEYFQIYSRHMDFDRSKALHLSRYLHDLGVFLHFQDDPLLARTVILQNQWATEAVFRILDDETVKARLGRFNRGDCERLWRDSAYADMHPELLALMQRFELCYELKDSDPPTWLAPQLSPPAKPNELADWGKPEDLVLRYCYEFLPKGIISRLTVRLHRFVRNPELAWVTGVLFERDSTAVLVELLANGSEIELRARGPERKALLSVIAADLDALNESFQGLRDRVDKRIPCNCKLCRTAAVPEFFAQKNLLRRKEDRRLRVECPASYEDVDVLELLDGIRVDKLPGWASEVQPATADRRLGSFSPPPPNCGRTGMHSTSTFASRTTSYAKRGSTWRSCDGKTFLTPCPRLACRTSTTKRSATAISSSACSLPRPASSPRKSSTLRTAASKRAANRAFIPSSRMLISKPAKRRRRTSRPCVHFRKKLSGLGHFYTSYDNIEHLKRQFRDQLDKMLA